METGLHFHGGNLSASLKDLLEAGVHFGHQTKRWNPKMKRFIFGERNGIYIIDLSKTARLFREAEQFVANLAAEGRTVLFVGTKRQAQDAIAEEARRSEMFFVNQRWLGGLLTNFSTIQRSLARLRDLEAMETDGRYESLSKKEIAQIEKEKRKLQKNLEGIRPGGCLMRSSSGQRKDRSRREAASDDPVIGVSTQRILRNRLRDSGQRRRDPAFRLLSRGSPTRSSREVVFGSRQAEETRKRGGRRTRRSRAARQARPNRHFPGLGLIDFRRSLATPA